MRFHASLLFLAFAATAPNANPLVDGDAEAGRAKSAPCAACHGPDGNSTNPQWPDLAGQHARYIVEQLQNFKSGARQNALMSPMAMGLSDEDMADLAAYYAAQAARARTADPALARVGERVYRGGRQDREVSACIACHGPDGQGNPVAIFPVLAGQHAEYVAMQLRAYAAGERSTDRNQMMRNIAAAMSEADIVAVSAYVQGLRGSP